MILIGIQNKEKNPIFAGAAIMRMMSTHVPIICAFRVFGILLSNVPNHD
jgi:hypothetical protein